MMTNSTESLSVRAFSATGPNDALVAGRRYNAHMYTAFLVIHSFVRWVVLLAGLAAVGRAIGGMRARRSWTPSDERAGLWLIVSLDVQFLVGAILYVALSPFTMPAWSDMAETMRNPALRFVVVEHVFGMVVAIALAHIGRVRIRKTADGVRRHKLAAIFFGIALVVIVLSIPWPGMPAGRPLLRGF